MNPSNRRAASGSRGALPAAVGLWLGACAARAPGAVPESTTATSAASPTSPSTQAAPTSQPSAPAVDALVAEAAEQVARVRELRVLEPVSHGEVDRETLLTQLRTKIREQYPEALIRAEGEALGQIGALPPGLDYEGTVLALLQEQVAGYYDPDRRRLFLAQWVTGAMRRMTLAHEITHALQDQHFDLRRFTDHTPGLGDFQLAAMSVVEGDATLTMVLQAARSRELAAALREAETQEAEGMARLREAPAFLRETLLFPYGAGTNMVGTVYRSGGFDAVNELLRTPPDSSEQVIHPDKLATREPPWRITGSVLPAFPADYEVLYDEPQGELGLRLVLGLPGMAQGPAPSDGWGGDRLLLLRRRETGTAHAGLPSSTALWLLVMDPGPRGPRDDTFAVAAARALQAHLTPLRNEPGTTRCTAPAASWCVRSPDGTITAIGRRGRMLAVLSHVPAALKDTVLATSLALPSAPVTDHPLARARAASTAGSTRP